MENKIILSVEELLNINDIMLGRGAPNQEDGMGYNKADYGACVNYFNGLSDAQVADLAKRLVKYSKTQLHLDKQMMMDTAEHYHMLVTGEFDRTDGVSVNVTENGTLISFRYNELFIEIIKAQPKRQYDGESKQWVVPNSNAINVLEALAEAGADVKNALEYVRNHELCKEKEVEKTEILTKYDGDFALLKFEYNKSIIDAIKLIDNKDRQWNPQFKFWAIKQQHIENLKNALNNVAIFKVV